MEIIPETKWPSSWFSLRELVRPHLQRLRNKNGYFTYLAVLDKSKLVTIDVAPGSSSSYYVPSGLRSCGVYSAPGKVLLAYQDEHVVKEALDDATKDHGEKTLWTNQNFPEHLKEVQEKGFGLDLEEHHRGLVCVAVPLLRHDGHCLASIGQSVLVESPNHDKLMDEILPVLNQTKNLLEEALVNSWAMPKEQEKNKVLSEALDFLMLNINKSDLDMGNLAESLHISHRQLTRMFKDHLNTSPYQYLLTLRFDKACQLLKNSEHSVKSIAISCGFSTSNNFCTAFKKRFNCSPENYRVSQQ